MVLNFFEEISKIPRGSGNEKEISDYLYNWAKKRNLFVIQDKAFNILIKKDGTNGFENSPAVILQGHLDMVCEKNMDTEHDFLKDSIKTYIDGDFIKAKGTTLGADNGIAVAMAMEILDRNDLEHPPLEVLLTTEEETGLFGAQSFDVSQLSGKYLINIDSEEEGEFLSSCAGGVRVNLSLPIEFNLKPQNFVEYNLFIKGLVGGHSGMEINSGRANSIVLLGRLLDELRKIGEIYLVNIFGGSLDNAIPRESGAIISVNRNEIPKLTEAIENYSELFKKENSGIDNNIKIIFEKSDRDFERVFTKTSTDKTISMITILPNGVAEMSKDLHGLVETSNNLGILNTKDNSVEISTSIRSSIASKKEMIINKFKNAAEILGAEITQRGNYPGWEYKKDSCLREIFLESYNEMFNKDGVVKAIHAGLECGIFAEQMELDIISLGPNIFDAHNPDERLSISSTENIFRLLLDVLKKLK